LENEKRAAEIALCEIVSPKIQTLPIQEEDSSSYLKRAMEIYNLDPDSQGWNFIGVKKSLGWVVHLKSNQREGICKFRGKFPYSNLELFQCFGDEEERLKLARKQFLKSKETKIINQNKKQIFLSVKFPSPFKDREVHYVSQTFTQSKQLIHLMYSINSAEKPINPKNVRALINLGAMIVDIDPENENHSILTTIWSYDMGGSLPMWLTNAMLSRQQFRSGKRFFKTQEKRKYCLK